uniref:Uncharacterized protein n=1 Tax=Molossus molossus TaxID=27622 RepID=A0A7J8CZI8_MOLMO|nr:hypothetical protein HJG59_009526 [Molossus molossus]
MVFLQAKEGFPVSCQLLQFLQRGLLLTTLSPATESSCSSFNVHIEVEYLVCRLSVVLPYCLSWLWVKGSRLKKDQELRFQTRRGEAEVPAQEMQQNSAGRSGVEETRKQGCCDSGIVKDFSVCTPWLPYSLL